MLDNFHLSQAPIKSSLISHTEYKHTFVVEPLLPGFGYTLGNSLRRVMVSNIPGFAVTKVRVNDLTHEYQAIDGVVEDALDIVLNLKQIRAKIITDDEKVSITLHKSEAGEVTARDFEKEARVEIVNPDQYICSLDKGAKLEIELEISRGVGYLSTDDIDFGAGTNPNEILVDALFSSVSNVQLNIDKVRVGEDTNFDKLTLDFESDGTVPAQEVVDYAVDLVLDNYNKIKSSMGAEEAVAEVATETPAVESADVEVKKAEKKDELDLPKRIKNILEKNEITTKAELKKRVKEVQDFPGITEKALETIKTYLKK